MLDSLLFLLGGIRNTLLIASGAAILAIVLAFGVGVLREAGGRFLDVALTIYVELFRGTSLLLQLFWLYYVLPLVGIDIPPLAAAIVGIGLNYGAYGSEVVRGAFVSVDKGQAEAARSLGLTPWRVLRLVLLPQILPVVIQPLGVLAVQLLKATSLASLITISDLSFRAYQLTQVRSGTGPVFGVVLVLYFVSAQAIVALTRRADRTAGRWRHLAPGRSPAARAFG